MYVKWQGTEPRRKSYTPKGGLNLNSKTGATPNTTRRCACKRMYVLFCFITGQMYIIFYMTKYFLKFLIPGLTSNTAHDNKFSFFQTFSGKVQ